MIRDRLERLGVVVENKVSAFVVNVDVRVWMLPVLVGKKHTRGITIRIGGLNESCRISLHRTHMNVYDKGSASARIRAMRHRDAARQSIDEGTRRKNSAMAQELPAAILIVLNLS